VGLEGAMGSRQQYVGNDGVGDARLVPHEGRHAGLLVKFLMGEIYACYLDCARSCSLIRPFLLALAPVYILLDPTLFLESDL
jgi:hypothetical protein